jgi:hypothetical protein
MSVYACTGCSGNRMNAFCWRVRFRLRVSRSTSASATVDVVERHGECHSRFGRVPQSIPSRTTVSAMAVFVPEGRADNSPAQAKRSPGKGKPQHEAAPEGRREPFAQSHPRTCDCPLAPDAAAGATQVWKGIQEEKEKTGLRLEMGCRGAGACALSVRRRAWLAFESPWFQVRRCANNTDLGAAHNAIRFARTTYSCFTAEPGPKLTATIAGATTIPMNARAIKRSCMEGISL